MFRLTPAGLALIEVAPGIDVERDILAHMAFAPAIEGPLPMDPRIFSDGPIELRDIMLEPPLTDRFSYDNMLNMLFMNFERLQICSERDVARIKDEVERRVLPLGRKVYAIVNYNGCTIEHSVLASYLGMVEALTRTCYLDVTRYGLSGPLAADLADAASGADFSTLANVR